MPPGWRLPAVEWTAIATLTDRRLPAAAGPAHRRTEPVRKEDLPSWVAWPVVLALTGASMALGLHDLTRRSLWLDEGYTWITAEQSTRGVIAVARASGYHLLGYELLIHWLTGWFGDSAFVMRVPSVVFGAAAVPCLYLLVARLGGRVAGLYAAALLTACAPLVFWQQNARDYSLVALLSVGSMLALVVAVQDDRLWAVVTWAVLIGAGVYTHPEMLLVAAPQAALLLLWARSVRLRVGLVVIGAAGAAAALPALANAAHSDVYQTSFVTAPTVASATEVATFLAGAAGTGAPVGPAQHALLLITFVIVVVGLAMLGADLAERGISPSSLGLAAGLSWLLVPPVLAWAVSQTGRPDFLDRYLTLGLPATATVLALVAARARPRALGLFAVAYLLVFRSAVVAVTYGSPLDDYRGATSYILSHSRPGDCITFWSDPGRILWGYYTEPGHRPADPAAVPVQALPPVNGSGPLVLLDYSALPVGVVTALQSEPRVRAAAAHCPRMWLLQSHPGSPTGTPAYRQMYMSLRSLQANLGHYYAQADRRLFTGIVVYRYDRPARPPRP